MAREFAVRFLPQNDGHVVPADVYVDVLHDVVAGLSSLRENIAPLLAERNNLPMALVREALEFGVTAPALGSLATPIVLGGGASGIIGDNADRRIAGTFWRYCGQALRVAARQGSARADVPAACAERFARAAKRARDGAQARVQLAERVDRRGDWRSLVDLSRIEQGLGQYAARRSTERPSRRQLVGRLLTLTYQPPGFSIAVGVETRHVSMAADLREAAHALWGVDVVADVETAITREGEIRGTPKLLALSAVVGSNSVLKDFQGSFGDRREIWGTEGAQQYIAELRRRDK